MKWGQVDEYVFLKESNYTSDKLSELNWEIKPEWYAGGKLSAAYKNLFIESLLKLAFPDQTGMMADSDWLNAQTYEVSAEKAAGHDYKTCYSEHDNYLESDLSFEMTLGYLFQLKNSYRIKPCISFEYNNISFTGKNGTGYYGYGSDGKFYKRNYYYAACDDKENQYILPFQGAVITYRRLSDYLWLGCNFYFSLPLNFELDTAFFLAPYVYAVSYDSHLTTGNDYADLTTGAFTAFKFNLSLLYKISPRNAFLVKGSYFYMNTLRGKNYEKFNTSDIYDKSPTVDGGAAASYFDLSLSYRLTIF